jgi:hypothetical protein
MPVILSPAGGKSEAIQHGPYLSQTSRPASLVPDDEIQDAHDRREVWRGHLLT